MKDMLKFPILSLPLFCKPEVISKQKKKVLNSTAEAKPCRILLGGHSGVFGFCPLNNGASLEGFQKVGRSPVT